MSPSRVEATNTQIIIATFDGTEAADEASTALPRIEHDGWGNSADAAVLSVMPHIFVLPNGWIVASEERLPGGKTDGPGASLANSSYSLQAQFSGGNGYVSPTLRVKVARRARNCPLQAYATTGKVCTVAGDGILFGS
jgi:hypothetical protein